MLRGIQKVFLWVRVLLKVGVRWIISYLVVCAGRSQWLAIVECAKSVQRQPCSGPMLAEVHLEVVTTVTGEVRW